MSAHSDLLCALAIEIATGDPVHEARATARITRLGVEVSTVEGGRPRQHLVHLDAQLDAGGKVEVVRVLVTHCGDCGEEIGHGAEWRDDRTATDRGTAGSAGWDGCATCIAWLERQARTWGENVVIWRRRRVA